MDEKTKKIITRSKLFAGIEEKNLDHLLKCLGARTSTYEKEDYIALMDAPFEGVGMILEGSAAVVKGSSEGEQNIVTALHEGETFGEVIAFIGQKTWPNAVQAHEKCKVLFFHPESVLNYCNNTCIFHRQLIGNLITLLSQKAYILNSKIEYLTIKSMRGKLSRYFYEAYKKTGNLTLSLPFNREKLAEFLNVSRPSMSRELCRMRDEGIIEFYKETIKIKDLDKLIQSKVTH